jgi:dephospho-CoA kinase
MKIGVTGGIGSGKSHICDIIESMGYPVFYTDNEAKSIITSNKDIKKFIIQNYGEDSYIDGKPNSKHLADILFNNDSEMKRLSNLTTPIIRDNLNDWLIKNDNYHFCFVESAIMFEYGLDKMFNSIICVSASLNTRIQRVLKRDTHRTREDVITIINKQFSEEDRIKLSNHIIFNDGVDETYCKPKEVLIEEIKEILNKIKC